MSSAICLDLDQSKILSSGNGLNPEFESKAPNWFSRISHIVRWVVLDLRIKAKFRIV